MSPNAARLVISVAAEDVDRESGWNIRGKKRSL